MDIDEYESKDIKNGRFTLHEYVRQNICQKQKCENFQHDRTKSGEVCSCGYEKTWHRKTEYGTPLDVQTAYGSIHFSGYGKKINKDALYLKVDANYSPEYMSHIWTVMQNYWGMTPPRLIILITGGAKRFDLQPRLTKALKTGLMNCTASTGAWLLTGGTKVGVRELVGEAVRDYYLTENASNKPIVSLGIITWDLLANKESLVCHDGKGLYPARYDLEDVVNSSGEVNPSSLDPNHSHFLMVDKQMSDGKREFSNSTFRAALTDSIKMPTMDKSSNDDAYVPVPKVIVIINGGIKTVEEVHKNVWNAKIPTVIVQGSGRAADYLAKAFQIVKFNGDEVPEFPHDFDLQMTECANMFEWHKVKDPSEQNKMMSRCVQQTKEIVQCKQLVTIFNMDSEFNNDLDTAILDALFKAHKSDLFTQLHFALSWNKCDIAQERIFSVENKQKWKKQEYKNLLHIAMFRALCHNQVEFVQMFLDNGVDWTNFLTVKSLKNLYYETLVKRSSKSETATLVYGIIRTEIMDEGNYQCCQSSKHMIKSEDKLLLYVGRLISVLLKEYTINIYGGTQYILRDDRNYKKSSSSNSYEMCRYAKRELFLWAVLLNRRDMAMALWKDCDSCLASALVASALLKALAKYAETNVEIAHSQDLLDHAMIFEQHAIGVLHQCFNKDRLSTHLLLVNENEIWGWNTVFSIAAAAGHMDFMEQTPCQTKLSKIWYGRMVQYTSTGKILGCMVCPFGIFGIKFIESPDKPEDMKMMKTLGEYGINKTAHQDITEHVRDEDNGEKDQVYSARCCGGCGDQNSISFIFAYIYFLHSPVVKFGFHTVFNLLFLGLFSYFVIVDLRSRSDGNCVSVPEYVIWAYALSAFLEEVRQMYLGHQHTITYRIFSYLNDLWNIFDLLASICLLIAVVLRYVLIEDSFVWARIFYCISLIFYYIRFMQVFFVEKNLGPKVIMINRMLKDMLFFILIIILFLLCYGTVSQALRNPNQELSWNLIKNLVYEPYWNIYGELFLEDLEAERAGCSLNDTAISLDPNLKKCPQQIQLIMIYVCFALYMLISNILLLNLLIAMFSHTFEKVQDNAEKVWRFYRYGLIYEYNDRPTLPPPFIIINHIYRLFASCWRKMGQHEQSNTEFRIALTETERNRLSTLEKMAMERYIHELQEQEQKNTDAKVTNTGKRVEKLSEDLDFLKEQATQKEIKHPGLSSPPVLSSPQQTDLEDMKATLNSLQSQMGNITQLLNDIAVQNKSQSAGNIARDVQGKRHSGTWITTCTAPDLQNVSDDETNNV